MPDSKIYPNALLKDSITLLDDSFIPTISDDIESILMMSVTSDRASGLGEALGKAMKDILRMIKRKSIDTWDAIGNMFVHNNSTAKANIAKLTAINGNPIASKYNESDSLRISGYMAWFLALTQSQVVDIKLLDYMISYEKEVETMLMLKELLNTISNSDKTFSTRDNSGDILASGIAEIGEVSLKTEAIFPIFMIGSGGRIVVVSLYKNSKGVIDLGEDFLFKIKSIKLPKGKPPSKVELLRPSDLITRLNDMRNISDKRIKKCKKLFDECYTIAYNIADSMSRSENIINSDSKDGLMRLVSSVHFIHRAVSQSINDKYTLLNNIAGITLKYYKA